MFLHIYKKLLIKILMLIFFILNTLYCFFITKKALILFGLDLLFPYLCFMNKINVS